MESLLSFFRMHWDDELVWIAPSVQSPALRRPGPAKAGTPNGRFMESVHFFLKCIGTMNPWTARQRLGLRQSSGAFGWIASIAKAPEDWRTPKPGGASDGSWRDPTIELPRDRLVT